MRRKWKRRWERAAAKISASILAAGIFFSGYGICYANPVDGKITTGIGTITANGSTMTITQKTDKLGINWEKFNILNGEKVNFIQPDVNSIALNRVIGSDASTIYGNLSANGKVFLINPNGILFARGAQVNVGGLVASSLNITDSNFRLGKYIFSGNSGLVVNQGEITAGSGGYVALLGQQVKNEGVIAAKQGTIAMGAGSKATLDFSGDGFLNLAVNESVLSALTDNSGLITADGGKVLMTARTAASLAKQAVNNSGVVRARSITSKNGTIILDGGANGTATNSNVLDASGKDVNQTGGTVRVLGQNVILADNARIDASGDKGGGTVLIGGNYQGKGIEENATNTTVGQNVTISADAITKGNGGQVVVWANDTTSYYGNISAKGGKYSGDGGNVEVSGKKTLLYKGLTNLTANNGKTGNLLLDPGEYIISTAATSGNVYNTTDLANQLNSANMTLQTDSSGIGDITVANDVTWTSGNTLTLKGNNDINVNAVLKSTGNGNVVLRADTDADSSGTVKFGTGGKVITDGTVSIYYNPGATTTKTINGTATTVKDYVSPTDYSVYVLNTSGTKNGSLSSYMLVNSLTDLQAVSLNLAGTYALGKDIDASATSTWNSDGSGGYYGFVPIGDNTNSLTNFYGTFDGDGHAISNLYLKPSATDYVGLFGFSRGILRNISLNVVNITGSNNVGGLVGTNYGSIDSSYSAGLMTGSGYNVGGLVGQNSGTITNSYNEGKVVNTGVITGGLVGANSGSIANSYNTGEVQGTGNSTGGLVGENYNTITGSSSTGKVSGSNSIGGLVGFNAGNGKIISSFSTSEVIGTGSDVGGLVAHNRGSIENSYYSTKTVTGSGDNVGGLVGFNYSSGQITGSYNTGGVSNSGAFNNTGGLAGRNDGDVTSSYNTGTVVDTGVITGGLVGANNGSITNSYNTGEVKGSDNSTGGLVGENYNTITGSSSTGKVSGTNSIGGLAGFNAGSGKIISSFSTSEVIGTGDYVGGLVGFNSGNIKNSYYSTKTVTGRANVGGVAGTNYGSIDSSYSAGLVTGSGDNIGGLVGFNYSGGTIVDSYWDIKTSNVSGTTKGVGNSASADGVTGLTTAQMQQSGSYAASWDFTNIWRIYDGHSYPLLKAFLTKLNVSADSVTKPYNGQAYTSSLSGVNYSIPADFGLLLGTLSYGSDKNVGTYCLDGLYSTSQQGYDITYDSASTLRVNKATLTITAAANSKTYDGTTSALATPTVSGLQTGDTVTNLSEAYTDQNVGTDKTLTVNSYTVNDGNSGNNYIVTTVNNTSGVIKSTPKLPLTSAPIPAPTQADHYNGAIVTAHDNDTDDAGTNPVSHSIEGKSRVVPKQGLDLTVVLPKADLAIPNGREIDVRVPRDILPLTDETMQFTALQSNGQPLPSWLSFDQRAVRLYGQPPTGFAGTIHVRITARDTKGNETSILFKLIIGATANGQEALPAETMKK